MVDEYPLGELLNNLEAIVFNCEDTPSLSSRAARAEPMPEPQQLRAMTGLEVDEFARVLGVSVSSVKRWEAKRTKPSATAQKLMQLLHAKPWLGRQLLQ
ncbi:HTH-type transcriptional regulator [Pantoea sp. 1.19]|uniref:HTH-type transcriptional regulator n=1 Tax=Pantoea sp. 1.19 TaxID=1925589 RepID=UPI0009491621|nr:HTH-type transcriptional regulator [Pantoea sp. 1.19]